MKKTYARILAGVMAAASAFSLSACSDDSGSGSTDTTPTESTTAKTEWTGDNVEVTVAEDAVDSDINIEGQTLKWMGFYDLNPTNDNPERSAEVALFEDTYGAKIQYIELSLIHI